MILVKENELNQILKSFYTLTGVRIAVFDEWQRELASYPPSLCDYCRQNRQKKDFDQRCRESDKKAFEQVLRSRAVYSYQCHAGLYESVYPIVSEGQFLGFLMIGQMICDEENFEFPPGDLQGKTHGVLSRERLESIAFIMSICSEYLCFSKTVSAQKIGIAKRAEDYVCSHLHEPLSVDRIGEYLGMSRTSVYLLFKKYFGKSVTEYVNYKKIQKAKELLGQNIPTNEILKQINLVDANYLYRLFKKTEGISFSEYKKQRI